MKNPVIIILLLLSGTCFGQVKPITEVEFGYEDRIFLLKDENGTVLGNDNDMFHNKIYTDVKLGIMYKGFNLSSSAKTFMHRETLIKFKPVYMEFRTGIKYTRKRFEIEYEHMCAHTMDAVIWRSGYDRIGLRIKIF